MYRPRERELTIKQYGRFTRAIDAPKYEPDQYTNYGGSRKANPNTPKARNNWGTAAHRALAIALNNNWQWYGTLQIAKEPVTAFDDEYNFIKKLTKRLQKQRERSESKDLAYLIVPDFAERKEVQEWFLHIWLQNIPKADKAFSYDIISEKEIIYHWKKHELHYGKSELYKIYDSGYTTNNKWHEQNAFEIFAIMERTAPLIPKGKNLYYSSNNVVEDIIIATGKPSATKSIDKAPTGNGFVYSQWFTSLDLHENIAEAEKYLHSTEWLEMIQREDEAWEEESTLEPNQPEDSFFSYDNYCCEAEYVPPTDDYLFCDNAEYYKPVEDFDYSVLNELYEADYITAY